MTSKKLQARLTGIDYKALKLRQITMLERSLDQFLSYRAYFNCTYPLGQYKTDKLREELNQIYQLKCHIY